MIRAKQCYVRIFFIRFERFLLIEIPACLPVKFPERQQNNGKLFPKF